MSIDTTDKAIKVDLETYQAPTYDRYGFQKKKTDYFSSGKVLAEKVKLLGDSDRRGIKLERKNDNIPHPSFDLNGDGVVCKSFLN